MTEMTWVVIIVLFLLLLLLFRSCRMMGGGMGGSEKREDTVDGYCYSAPNAGHNVCICSGPGGRICQNVEQAQKEYHDGMNEYQDFSKTEPKKWSTVSPGDYTWNMGNEACRNGGYIP